MTPLLYRYQLEDVRRIHQLKGRALVAWEPGLGKTILSLSYYVRHPELRPAVVVCPASIKYQWESEAVRLFGLRAEVLSGTKPPSGSLLINYPLMIINYDILPYWLDYFQRLDVKLVIIDECHFASNRKAKRTRGVQKLCKGVDSVIALSGTPLTNRPAELWPVLNIVRPDLYGSYWNFCMKYANPKRTPWGWDLRGASNLEELHTGLTHDLMIRRRKDDVLKELPPKTRTVLPLEIDNRKEYQQATNDFIAWMMKRNPHKLSSAEKAQRLVQLGYLKRLAAQLKLNSVFSWLDNHLQVSEGKVIVFAIHIDTVVRKLEEHYKKTCVVVTGDVSLKNRNYAVSRFQNDKTTRVFIGNIDAAGVGLNLTAANTVVFTEIAWVPAKHTQGEDRSNRIGQVNPVNIYYLVGKDTIETKLISILQSKQEILNQVLDGDGKGDQLDVFDKLTESIMADRKNAK